MSIMRMSYEGKGSCVSWPETKKKALIAVVQHVNAQFRIKTLWCLGSGLSSYPLVQGTSASSLTGVGSSCPEEFNVYARYSSK